jgi:hypothetical protein
VRHGEGERRVKAALFKLRHYRPTTDRDGPRTLKVQASHIYPGLTVTYVNLLLLPHFAGIIDIVSTFCGIVHSILSTFV